MKLYTKQQYDKLVKNGLPENINQDKLPVVKWFTPDGCCTWIVSEIIDEQTAFGLCDLNMGFPELGYIHIPEILQLRGCLGLPVERDLHFNPRHLMSVYAEAAHFNSAITENENALEQARLSFEKK